MVRGPSVDTNGLKKGTWSEEEDNKLRAYVLRYGHWNWRQLPRFAGLSRCGKSCRLRWMNYLKPGIRRGTSCKDEDEIILKLHKELGNKWSAIAAKLPGRSDNEIKNHWHTHLKKRLHVKQDPETIESKKQINETVQSAPADQVDQPSENTQEAEIAREQKQLQDQNNSAIYDTAISPYSQEKSCSEVSSTLTSSHQSFEEPFESFWNELLLADTIYGGKSYTSSESEGGLIMSSYNSTVEEDFTLPCSFFCYDDINFLNNFMQ